MIKNPLENINGELYIDGVSTLKLAQEFDTPLYVVSEKKIRKNYKKLCDEMSSKYKKKRILFSAKANTSLSILKILKDAGANIDAVSIGEVFLALKAGFLPEQILYTGTNVRNDELEYLLKKRVMINIDSLSQLHKLLRIKIPEILSIRVNPELGAGHHEHVITAGKMSKFGVWESTAVKAYEVAKKAGVQRFGIHMHIGSGIMNYKPFILAAEKLLKIVRLIREKIKINFDFIDFGGGIGVPYRPEEKEADLELFIDKLTKLYKEKIIEYSLGEPELWIEPGRYLVAEASILLTRVNTLKTTPFRNFVGIDAGFNTLIRPAMYGSYHHILVANKLTDPSTEKYDVAGPLCESGDIMTRDRLLCKLKEGDWLAILTTGAYGFSMSSQYNSKPRPAEVLVKEGAYELIRKRERLQDLVKGQRIAGWLEK